MSTSTEDLHMTRLYRLAEKLDDRRGVDESCRLALEAFELNAKPAAAHDALDAALKRLKRSRQENET